MANLITAAQFATYRNISKKIDTEKIDESIKQAQESDLINIIGDFYFDVVKNATETEWQDLLNGSTFEYLDQEYEHAGIKAMLADYAHARYVYKKPINDTAFGLVQKSYDDSKPIDRAVLRDLMKQDQQDAGTKFIYIEKYILSKPVLFSRYCKNKTTKTGFNETKISIL